MIHLDMYQTIAAAVVALMLGKFLRKRVNILERFCIPAPVIGGVVFAVRPVYVTSPEFAEFSFVIHFKRSLYGIFFHTVGFQAT